MIDALVRSIKTTFKQIKRSGWLSWASVAVMTLSFLVTTIFLALALVLNLVLKSIENEPHIYIFYNAGTQEEKILKTKEDWAKIENIESIVYTSEKDAIAEFKKYNEKSNPITAEAIRENILPASLGIRLKKIEDANQVIQMVEKEKETNVDVLSVGYSETVIQNIKEIVNIVRIVGAIIIIMLVIVILLFSLLTVEFRIFNRSEEIGIMQLVGGDIWYIRLPFILESTIYGVLGAGLSNLILIGSFYGIKHYYSQTELMSFIYRFFGSLPWPAVTTEDAILIFLAVLGIGGFIGMINSLIAISRYIK